MCAKRLLLIRHAKSSWKDTGLEDFQRPLNKRGERDAPLMGALLNKKNIVPDLLISSHAVRARKTADKIIKELGIDMNNLRIDERLYEASYIEILEVLKEIDESINTLILFGHNPGFTTFHNFICPDYIDNIPTCGIVEYEVNLKWKDLSASCCTLVSFEYPKKFFK
jgi:phosphohistidine phosphatase